MSLANEELVYEATRLTPSGQVTTYGAIARLIGLSPRLVGRILHHNPRPGEIPCQRVVRSDGRLASAYAFGGPGGQKRRLLADGVEIKRGRVKLKQHLAPAVHSKGLRLYFVLLKHFGLPPVWPWSGPPARSAEEIVVGAILTQRTSWRNVEKALVNLRLAGVNNLEALRRLGEEQREKLERLIRPSGFYRQKTERLTAFTKLVEQKGGWGKFKRLATIRLRETLLKLKGIGPETADTILLYALNRPVFVIDEYTRRFVRRYRLTRASVSYDILQKFFTDRLPTDIKLFQRYHALIVLWGKEKADSLQSPLSGSD